MMLRSTFQRLLNAPPTKPHAIIPIGKFHSSRCIKFKKLSILDSGDTKLYERSKENRRLILDILKLTTTRRETTSYLNKYSTFDNPNASHHITRLIFIKIKGNLFDYPFDELSKLTKTLNYMKQLGGQPVIVLDPDYLLHNSKNTFKTFENYLINQFNYLNNISTDGLKFMPFPTVLTQDFEHQLKVDIPEEMFRNIKNIPVLFPILYDNITSRQFIINSTDFFINIFRYIDSKTDAYSIEKLIVIDTHGGIPSIERSNNSHVLINLNQEFNQILAELNIGHLSLADRKVHIENLTSFENILKSIKKEQNKTLTGIITTLDIATENLNANPIIYNILTDRSLISSSLPTGRINSTIYERISKTSIIKNGLIINEITNLNQLDLIKFKDLIDDSFKRPLDLNHYLERISKNLIKIFIIGDYDGVAIVTLEHSKSTGLKVPYLDKFAISRKSQGVLAIADIIFNLLKQEFGNNLLWRSRKNNPVNSWYFQRSTGSYNLKNEFKVFWLTNIRKPIYNERTLNAYIEIGEMIKPSWES
ncbi:hypothetical protein WICMUC_002097 [Wickerhamomyces mucosus]|uniref:Amino-acid acetyltransferase, mitochondrial n=1 Tax=Wickerhamomyces mucosus TaxID=1378264 RepID=A0A9P8PQE4_9ASCO|nr:hypothetical protein WICMUC_002097 [Wickerhamomyces mucosus]